MTRAVKLIEIKLELETYNAPRENFYAQGILAVSLLTSKGIYKIGEIVGFLNVPLADGLKNGVYIMHIGDDIESTKAMLPSNFMSSLIASGNLKPHVKKLLEERVIGRHVKFLTNARWKL